MHLFKQLSKVILLLCCVLLLSPFSDLQSQGWYKTYPEINNLPDENPRVFSGIQQTPDQGFITWGSKGHGFSQETIPPVAYEPIDINITKTDLSGNVQWSQWYNNGETPEMSDLITFELSVAPDGYLGIGNVQSDDTDGHVVRGIQFDQMGSIVNSFEFNAVDLFGFVDVSITGTTFQGDTVELNAATSVTKIIEVMPAPDNTFIVLGSHYRSGYATVGKANHSWLIKIDINGNIIWNAEVPTEDYQEYFQGNSYEGAYTLLLTDLDVSTQGEILVTGGVDPYYYDYSRTIFKFDANGNVLWNNKEGYFSDVITGGIGQTVRQNAMFHPNGNIVSQVSFKSVNFHTSVITAMGPQGDTLWFNQDTPSAPDYQHVHDICPLKGNKIGVLYATGENSQTYIEGLRFGALNMSDGSTFWEGPKLPAYIGNSTSFGERHRYLNLIPNSKIGMVIAGQMFNQANTQQIPFIMAPGSQGFVNTAQVNGSVFIDTNQDCLPDATEQGIPDNLILGGIATTLTNEDGNYTLDLYEGEYTLINTFGEYPYELWQSDCEDSIAVTINTSQDVIEDIDFGFYPVVEECPRLQVQTGIPFLRPGFYNPAYVSYSNVGTAAEDSAYIYLILEPYMTIDSASLNFTYDPATNTYEFFVGEIDMFETGGFVYNVYIAPETELNITGCVQAFIAPFDRCNLEDPNWDRSELRVAATCVGDSIEFEIENIGEDMMMSRDYAIYADNLLKYDGSVQLGANEVQVMKKYADGSTFRITAEQAEYFPEPSFPEASVESCNTNEPPTTSINTVARNDQASYIDIECTIVTGSYDPNDKQVVPSGIGEERYVNSTVQLEYKVRFQNTGTDTAFNVFVLDTLSEHLDLATFQSGVASHDYEVSILPGRVIRWDFRNILLPDSSTNLIGSNGFIKFTMRFASDVPQPTEVHNTANIYFDFNEPIVTEDMFVTVCDECLIQTLATEGVYFDGKILLEGAYDSNGQMQTSLQDLLPKTQPYNSSPYFYDGDETIVAIPAEMVDWVLVEARAGTPNISGDRGTTTVETKAGLLFKDGSIRGIDGISGITFNNLEANQSYHFCIRHRNHLDVLTATALSPSTNMVYDFTNNVAQAFGNQQMKWLGPESKAVLFTGDFNADGIIQTTDYDLWFVQPAAVQVYDLPDANLDGVIQVSDYDKWFFNKAKVGAVEIGY